MDLKIVFFAEGHLVGIEDVQSTPHCPKVSTEDVALCVTFVGMGRPYSQKANPQFSDHLSP